MDPIPLPAPYAGINQSTPIIELKSPFCQTLLNFFTTEAGIELRNGHSKYGRFQVAGNNGALSNVICLTPYGDTALFALVWCNTSAVVRIYNVDTGTLVHTSAAAAATSNFYSVYFNRYQFWFSDSAILTPGLAYNGSAGTFGTIGYAAAAGSPVAFQPIGGDVFNHRGYWIQRGSAGYWYTQLYAITGDCYYVDLSTIVQEECTLSIICNFTLSDNVAAVRLQAFVFSNGEVLFYSGSYPDSSDWTAAGSAKIAQPLDYNSYLNYQGDALVMCDSGLVSMRDLFLKGSENAASLTVSDGIQKPWQDLVKAARSFFSKPAGPLSIFISAVWDTKNNRLIIQFPFYLDTTIKYGGYFFIYNCDLQSWSTHKTILAGTGGNSISAIRDMARYKNKVLLLSQNASGIGPDLYINVSEYGAATGFTDRNSDDSAEVTYDYETISAPVANGRTYVQLCAGIEEIVETDLYAQTQWRLIRDLGVQTSNPQVVSGAVSGSLQKTFINLGIEGSYIQYKMSGTTTTSKTVGLNLYGINFWEQMGNAPR